MVVFLDKLEIQGIADYMRDLNKVYFGESNSKVVMILRISECPQLLLNIKAYFEYSLRNKWYYPVKNHKCIILKFNNALIMSSTFIK